MLLRGRNVSSRLFADICRRPGVELFNTFNYFLLLCYFDPMNQVPSNGRQRLGLLLCLTGSLSSAGAMLMVLIFYGVPYSSNWWWLMAAIWVACSFVPYVFVYPIEWVIKGYKSED